MVPSFVPKIGSDAMYLCMERVYMNVRVCVCVFMQATGVLSPWRLPCEALLSIANICMRVTIISAHNAQSDQAGIERL